MRVGDLSPFVWHAIGGVAGLAVGAAGARLADALPPRYGIRHLVTGAARTRRNVALVAIALALSLALAHVVARFPEASMTRGVVYLGANILLSAMAVTAAAIDLEHMILPNELMWGGAVLALASAQFRGLAVVPSLVGLVTGLVLTYVPFVVYKKLRGRSGMGLGDANLAAFAGAWLGWEGAFFIVFAGALQSAAAAGVMRVAGLSYGVPASVQAEIDDLRAKAAAGDEDAKKILDDDPMAADVDGDGRGVMTMRLPMGPFLVLACLEFLFARRWILTAFDRMFGP